MKKIKKIKLNFDFRTINTNPFDSLLKIKIEANKNNKLKPVNNNNIDNNNSESQNIK